MTVRKDKTEIRAERLQTVIRRALRGEKIDAATIAWLRSVQRDEVVEARLEIVKNVWYRLIKLGSERPLYPGDKTIPSKFEFYDEVVAANFAYGLLEEIGSEKADAFFEDLALLVRYPS